jgi:hypothetical protein
VRLHDPGLAGLKIRSKRTDDGLFVFTRTDGTRIEDNGQKAAVPESLPVG